MKTRVLMFLDEVFPPDPRVEREAFALTEAGFEVHLWAFCTDKSKSGKISNHSGIYIHHYFPGRLTIKSGALANDVPIYTFLLKEEIRRAITEINPSVLHIHDIRVAPVVFSIRPKQKVILDMHENRPEIMRFYPHLRKFPGKFLISPERWIKKERQFVKQADAIVIVTKESQNQYKDIVKKSAIVTNSLSMNKLKENALDPDLVKRFKGHFTLLYIGDLGKRRGIGEAIGAVKLLSSDIPELLLVLVGDSTDRAFFEGKVKELEVEKHVVFEGFQPPDVLPSYIMAAEIGLCPIHRNPHHDTTYANKLFQYMAMGLPQVVSDCTAQANLIKSCNAGLVHEAGNDEDLAQKIKELYESSELQEKISQDSIAAMVNIWDWDKQKGNLLNLYKSLL